MSTYRICALGNSHIAAAKLGWDEIAAEFPDYAFDFFGFAPGTSVDFGNHVKVENGALVATSDAVKNTFAMTSGGRQKIEGAAYSAFVMFGLGLGGPTGVRMVCSRHRPLEVAAPGAHLISSAALKAAIEGRLRSDQALAPVRALRAISRCPIISQSIPAPTVNIIGDPEHADDVSSVPGLLTRIRRVYDDLSVTIGDQETYKYLSQPPETLDETGLTRHEYIVDGVGMNSFKGGTKPRNTGHGNKAYGVIVMRQVLHELQQAKLALGEALKTTTTHEKGQPMADPADKQAKANNRRVKAIRDRLKAMTEERKKLMEELAALGGAKTKAAK
ncbi:MAG: hypothetical protein IT548_06705 [Alphaproteobacteria bacterium]|nr:hypothetical protein [Alphaproteobacteria bacterium]